MQLKPDTTLICDTALEEDQVIRVLLRGEHMGIFKREPGVPTRKYAAPVKSGGSCIDCGRPKYEPQPGRCRECYSARSSKNALWSLKLSPANYPRST